jgi:hypothetical protein
MQAIRLLLQGCSSLRIPRHAPSTDRGKPSDNMEVGRAKGPHESSLAVTEPRAPPCVYLSNSGSTTSPVALLGV